MIKLSKTHIPLSKRYLMELYIHEWMSKGIKSKIAILNKNSTSNTDNFYFILNKYFILYYFPAL